MQPTVEVRRTRLGHVCKDKPACTARIQRVQERAKSISWVGTGSYDLNDPKNPEYAAIAVDYADMQRKRDKGE